MKGLLGQGAVGLLVSAFSSMHNMMRRDFLVSGAMGGRINEDDPKKVAEFAVKCADHAIELMDNPKKGKRF